MVGLLHIEVDRVTLPRRTRSATDDAGLSALRSQVDDGFEFCRLLDWQLAGLWLRTSSIDLLFRRLCALNYVTLGEKNTSELGPPVLGAAEQEFQVHTEVLEFLFLRIRHDCFGLLVPFDRHALFVPAYGFRFLDQ